MGKLPVKPPTQKEKRNLIKERLLLAPQLSNRAIAEFLGISHVTVGKVRHELEESGKIARSVESDDWSLHPYLKKNPDIVKNLNTRRLRAIRAPGVIEKMSEIGSKSPVYAQRVLHKEAEAIKNAPVDITKSVVEIRCDDVSNGLHWIPSGSVDAVIVDAPYGGKYIDVYQHIGSVSARVLRPGGSLVVMSGQVNLPDKIAALSQHLKYQWSLSYITSRGSNKLLHLKVMPSHKICLWYVKDKYTGKYVFDVIQSPPPAEGERTLHKWEQSLKGFEQLVKLFSEPNDTVLDCCMGSGTTGLACINLGRKFIGCDIDAQAVETAKERIAETLRE